MTESPRIVDLPVEGEGLLLLIVAGIGVLLLLLNVLMILACAWKRSKNNKKGTVIYICEKLIPK